MVRHQLQFPVQLEGAQQLLNHPKNVAAVPSALTSSLINNNCLSTLRDMMLQQQHQYQQQFQQKYQKIDEHNSAALPSHHTISASTSPNLSSKTPSPKQFVQKISPVPFRVLEATASENGHNSKKMQFHDGIGSDRVPYTHRPEQHNSSRTVREELAASRSKVTTNGKFN